MPSRKYTGYAFENNLFGRPKRRRGPVAAPPTVDYQDAVRVGRALGYIRQQSPRGQGLLVDLQHEDNEWVDVGEIEENPGPDARINAAAEAFARISRGSRFAEMRQRLLQKWKDQEKEITATLLVCQHTTSNWTTKESYLTEGTTCTCNANQVKERPVDLIDLHGRHHGHMVTFCSCTKDSIRLINLGYLPGSPQFPRTAFSIRLVQLHHYLWTTTMLSSTGFIEGLTAFLNQRSHTRLLGRGQNHGDFAVPARKLVDRNLRRPFNQSVNIYRRFLRNQTVLYKEGLALTSQNLWANQCPRCFGPAEGELKENSQEPHTIIAMDGNFQHRHHIFASRDSLTDEDYPSNFLTPTQIKPHQQAFEASNSQARGINTACSDSHTAANDVRNSSSWDLCDDNGLFACACRHDVPMRFANVFQTGEKQFYPVSILDNILTELPDLRFGVLYDIGCHLDVHIKKRNLIPQHQERLMFGTSVFHAYVHEWSCQIRYNPRFNAMWGLSDGEGLERIWSFLSPLVAPLRVSTRLQRLESIQLCADIFAKKKMDGAGRWLSSKLKNAMNVMREANISLALLYQKPNAHDSGHKYHGDFLRNQWELERRTHGSKDFIMRKQKLELGRLLVLEDELHQVWHDVSATPDEALRRMHTAQELERVIKLQRQKVGTYEAVESLENREEADLLKLWYSKYEVRNKYLQLCEEKRPLQQSRQGGRQSNLGTRGKTALLNSIRKRAGQLHKILDTFRARLAEFKRSHPHRPCPGDIDYPSLLAMKPDDPFWNDALFTNYQEPWAIDPDTQHGMRQIAYVDRANEEIRRLGWEVRRCMRWAVTTHTSLFQILSSIQTAFPTNAAASLAGHPILESLPDRRRCIAGSIVIHTRWVELINLQERWNMDFLQVLQKTKAQALDIELLDTWNSQLASIAQMRLDGFCSNIPGHLNHFPSTYTGLNELDDEHDSAGKESSDEEDAEDDDQNSEAGDNDQRNFDGGEQAWVDALDAGVVREALLDFELAPQESNIEINLPDF